MIRSKGRVRLALCLLALNLAFIWGNSLLPGQLSLAFSEWIGKLFSWIPADGIPPGKGTGILRKTAHFTEFLTLGMCLGWLTGMLGRSRKWAFTGGMLAACIDETIQIFTPGRGPRLLDVCIDGCGVFFGITLLYFGYSLYKRKYQLN